MTEILWALSRSTGLIALVLFTAALICGALVSGRAGRGRAASLLPAGLHRTLSLAPLLVVRDLFDPAARRIAVTAVASAAALVVVARPLVALLRAAHVVSSLSRSATLSSARDCSSARRCSAVVGS